MGRPRAARAAVIRGAGLHPFQPPSPEESGWRISVKDNGLGIEPAHTDQIFKMFQRLHGRDDPEKSQNAAFQALQGLAARRWR